MIKSHFTIQIHKQKNKSHWDLRVLNKNKSSLLSWAIPKCKFPKIGEKLLAIQTPNHAISYMTYHGKLKNGETVELYDGGLCNILKYTNDRLILDFKGTRIKGVYKLVKIHSKDKNVKWLLMK